MPFHVKSSEVLRHLKNYGIDDIDDADLQLFIRDLKRLIKYEQRRQPLNTSNENKFPHKNVMPVNNISLDNNESAIRKDENRKTRFENAENICPTSEDVGYRCCQCRCRNKTLGGNSSNIEITRYDTHEISPSNSLKSNDKKSCNCKSSGDRDKKTSNSVNENSKIKLQDTPRPASLVSNAKTNVTKCKKQNPDPVELYHHYQSIWKYHKLPGENDHAQLRQKIRNRLMKAK